MPDLDLVIRGLEHCREYGYLGGNCCNGCRKDCPYCQLEAGCVAALLNDVNAMLKEQEQSGSALRMDCNNTGNQVNG